MIWGAGKTKDTKNRRNIALILAVWIQGSICAEMAGAGNVSLIQVHLASQQWVPVRHDIFNIHTVPED